MTSWSRWDMTVVWARVIMIEMSRLRRNGMVISRNELVLEGWRSADRCLQDDSQVLGFDE